MQMFAIRQLRALGWNNYMIDLFLKVGTINPGTPGTNVGPNELPITVKIGSQTAIDLGWLDGQFTVSHPKFKDRGIVVLVDHILIDSHDMGAGDPFFEKDLVDTFVTFRDPLSDGQTYTFIIT